MFQSSGCVLYDGLKKRKKGHESPFFIDYMNNVQEITFPRSM